MSYPERIVSLLPGATETLFALGLGDRVVAVSHECDYPPQVAALPKVTRATIQADASSAEIDRQTRQRLQEGQPLFELDMPLLATLQPDLIITQSHCAVCAVAEPDVRRSLAGEPQWGHVRVLSLQPSTLDDVWGDILRIGEATQKDAVAQGLVARLKLRVQQVEQDVAALQRKPRRVICLEWMDPPILSGNWIPDLLRIVGGASSGVPSGQPSRVTGWQDVVEFRPDVVILIPCGFTWQRTYRELTQLERIHPLRTLLLRQAEVYVADGNAYFNRSGPRLVDSLEILAQILYPELTERIGTPASHALAWRKIVLVEDAVQLAAANAGA